MCSVLYEFDSEKAFVSKRQVNLYQPNLRPAVVHSPYLPSYDFSNIPVYEIYSWKMVIYDRKIAAIILYIGSTLGTQIYSKFALNGLLRISLAYDYICWLEMLYMRDFWCQTCNTFIKNVQFFF